MSSSFNATKSFLILLIFFAFTGKAIAADLNKGLKALKARDFKTAYNELRPLADQGNAKAQYNLGRMYSKGDYVSLNQEKAVNWYRKSAEQGYKKGLNNLGLAYYLGNGVQKNYKIAYMFFGVAAELGHERSKKNVGIVSKHLSKRDIEDAKEMVSLCLKQKYKGCEGIN